MRWGGGNSHVLHKEGDLESLIFVYYRRFPIRNERRTIMSELMIYIRLLHSLRETNNRRLRSVDGIWQSILLKSNFEINYYKEVVFIFNPKLVVGIMRLFGCSLLQEEGETMRNASQGNIGHQEVWMYKTFLSIIFSFVCGRWTRMLFLLCRLVSSSTGLNTLNIQINHFKETPRFHFRLFTMIYYMRGSSSCILLNAWNLCRAKIVFASSSH